MKVFAVVLLAAAVLYWVLLLLVVGILVLGFWVLLRPFADAPMAKPVEEVRLMPRRRRYVARRAHSPAYPLAYLPMEDWKVWVSVIADAEAKP